MESALILTVESSDGVVIIAVLAKPPRENGGVEGSGITTYSVL